MSGGTGLSMPPSGDDVSAGERVAASRRVLTGDEALALAVRQARPHVITACDDPVRRFGAGTPAGASDQAMGPVFVEANDDREAVSISLGAAAGGCRVFASIGGHRPGPAVETCCHAGALRLGMVVGLAGGCDAGSQSAGAPWFWDAPCVQFQAESAQEAYDSVLLAFCLAGDLDLRLPVIVGLAADGGRMAQEVATLSDEQAAAFVGEFAASEDLLDVEHPHGLSLAAEADATAAMRGQIGAAMRLAPERIERLAREYEALTGRSCGMAVGEEMDGARVAVVATGSQCRAARSAMRALRREGLAVGLVKLRVLRPFPRGGLADLLLRPGISAVCVLDAAVELGSGGPLFRETAAALAVGVGLHGGGMPRLGNLIVGGASEEAACADLRSVLIELSAPSGGDPALDPVRFAGRGVFAAGSGEQGSAAWGAGQRRGRPS